MVREENVELGAMKKTGTAFDGIHGSSKRELPKGVKERRRSVLSLEE